MRCAPKLLCCAVVSFLSFPVIAQENKSEPIDEIEPEMVWVSYAQGAVKFSPGKYGAEKLGKEWIQANRGQVMEEGYTLATEEGKAEIEFEDGSVVFLAEHSVLGFDRLWTQGETTETVLSVLTGTVTVWHAQSTEKPTLVTKEFTLFTPTARMRFGGNAVTTVECALDGIRVKEIEGVQSLVYDGRPVALGTGDEVAVLKGRMVWLKGSDESGEENEWKELAGSPVRPPEVVENTAKSDQDKWDAWVEARITTRRALIAKGLKESGMKEPIPGLAEMVVGGTFFDCAPYGKCWEANDAVGPGTEKAALEPAVAVGRLGGAQVLTASATHRQQGVSGTATGTIVVNPTMTSRCPMQAWRVTSQGGLAANGVQYGPCFAGSWSDTQWDPCGRWPLYPWYTVDDCFAYPTMWVVGRRHHHPCHFLKTKHGIGLVPRHPNDKPGRPPVNAKNGVLVLTTTKGHLHAGMEPLPSRGLPSESRVPWEMLRSVQHEVETAPRVERPVIEAKLAESFLPKGLVPTEHGSVPKNVTGIRFDYHSGNFIGQPRGAVGSGGHGVVVGHVGGGGGGIGGHGGGGGGGFHGGGGGGGASGGGGGGHSGGGASGGGGGGGGGGHH